MEIIYFIAGFIAGALCIFAIFSILQKKSEKTKEDLMQSMQIQFENLTNKIFKEQYKDKLINKFIEESKLEKIENIYFKVPNKIKKYKISPLFLEKLFVVENLELNKTFYIIPII